MVGEFNVFDAVSREFTIREVIPCLKHDLQHCLLDNADVFGQRNEFRCYSMGPCLTALGVLN